MAVSLTRNAFAENRPDLFVVLSKRSENVLFRFFLHKTTNRYNFRKIFAVLSVILRLQKRGTDFLGNDHHHHHHHHQSDYASYERNMCNNDVKYLFYTDSKADSFHISVHRRDFDDENNFGGNY